MVRKRLLVLALSAVLGFLSGCTCNRSGTCSTSERPGFFQRFFRRDNGACCDIPPGCCDGPMLGDGGPVLAGPMPGMNGSGMMPMAPQTAIPNLAPPPGTRIQPQPQPLAPLAPVTPQSQPQPAPPR